MTIKEQILKAMNDNDISSDNPEDSIYFVEQLLQIFITDTEENEPYATNTIREMQIAKNRMSFLVSELHDHI